MNNNIRNEEIAILLLNGESVTNVAKRFKLSSSTIYNIADAYNIKVKKNYSQSAKKAFLILRELFDPNKTMVEIGNELNVTHQRVSQIYGEAKFAQIPGLPIR